MKIPYKLLSIAFISTFIFGCSSTSIQNVVKPDINQPINEHETIIQLKRADHFQASLNNAIVHTNEILIGELANADELVWKTKANTLECITLEHEASVVEAVAVADASLRTGVSIKQRENFLKTGIRLDEVPVAYKCFETKPKAKMILTYDFGYPESRVFRGLAFMPVFKLSPTFDRNTTVTVNVINSISTETQNEKDIKSLLENSVKKQFGDNFASSSNRTIDIEILDYKTGNAAARWVVKSMKGSTFAKVKVTTKVDGQVVETFITRPVVSRGGGFSVGADEYIFDEVAEDIYLHLFGNNN